MVLSALIFVSAVTFFFEINCLFKVWYSLAALSVGQFISISIFLFIVDADIYCFDLFCYHHRFSFIIYYDSLLFHTFIRYCRFFSSYHSHAHTFYLFYYRML